MHFSKHSFCFSLLILSFIFFGCGKAADSKKNDQSPPPAVEGLIIRAQHLEQDIDVSGTIIPSEETVLMPEISGRITFLHLPEGTRVSKGTLLVKLFDADLQAQLSKLNAQLKTAKATEERQKELLKVNGLSQEEFDQTVTLVTSIEADIADMNAQISKTEIRAPFNGTIGLKKISEGAFVSPGTPLAVIREDQDLKIDFDVPESYGALITNGMNVSFTVDGDSTHFTAQVIATEKSVDVEALNLKVRAKINGHNPQLLPGSSATVNLSLGSTENAILVPTQAVIPQARFKNIIVVKNGKSVFAKVKTGVRRPADIEIISGLKIGDTIVTTGIQFIRPGTVLKFSSVK
jgi:membrane fusion protein (multidrug efflux system)